MLVDGNSNSAEKDKKQNTKSLDYVVTMHLDTDHIEANITKSSFQGKEAKRTNALSLYRSDK